MPYLFSVWSVSSIRVGSFGSKRLMTDTSFVTMPQILLYFL